MAADREGMSSAVKERELIAAVEGRSERLGSREALEELGRRDSRRRTDVLAGVLSDARRPVDLRAVAAVELGKQRKPEHQEALVGALRSGDPTLTRRAAEALGRIGDEAALQALRALRPGREPVRRSVRFARTLIAYRLGLDGERLQPPAAGDLLRFDRRRSIPLEAKRVGPKLLDRVRADARRELPALPIAPDGALRFACGATEFVVVFARDAVRPATLARLGRRSAVPAVVLRRPAGLERFSVYEYLLTHPQVDGTLALFGVRATGVVAHTGRVELQERAATFELRAAASRYSPPVRIEGTYDHARRRLAFAQALVHRDFTGAQKEATQAPRPLGPGLR